MIKRFYKIHDFHFSLSTNCDNAGVRLERLFPALHTETAECSTEWHFQRVAEHAGLPLYTVYANGKAALQSDTLSKALDYVEWSITTRILHTHSHFLQIHAAALVFGERALVISGPPGSGKSSLALSLLLQGWGFLSDEIVFLDPSSYRIFSFPRNLHVSSETLRHFPTLERGYEVCSSTDASGKSRIDAALIPGSVVMTSALPWSLVFPDHRPDYITALTPLGKTASLALLTAQTINLGEFGMRGLEALSHFVGTCDSYTLTSSDLISASRALSRFGENTTPLCINDNHSGKIDRNKNITMPIGVS